MRNYCSFPKFRKDFVNENKDYQSKIDLGISSLVTNDFSKAKQMFDAAIELDSFPSAWLGKAFRNALIGNDFNSQKLMNILTEPLKVRKI